MNRVRITIQNVARVDAGGGGYEETWANDFTTRAEHESLGGREELAAMQVGIAHPHRFVTWFRPQITPHARLIFHDTRRGDRVCNIRSVRDLDDRPREVEILADEVAA